MHKMDKTLLYYSVKDALDYLVHKYKKQSESSFHGIQVANIDEKCLEFNLKLSIKDLKEFRKWLVRTKRNKRNYEKLVKDIGGNR